MASNRSVWVPLRSRQHWSQRRPTAGTALCPACQAVARPKATVYDPSHLAGQARGYKNYIRAQYGEAPAADGSSTGKTRTARIPLKNGSVFGLSATRGVREYQEDAACVECIELPSKELKAGLLQSRSKIAHQLGEKWDADKAGGEELASQVLWVGCFDGHGGQAVSGFLRSSLHDIFERVTPSMATDVVQYTREHGGYFRRFTGGLLERWVRQDLLKSVRAGGPGGAGRMRKAPSTSKSSESTSTSAQPRTLSDLAASLSGGGKQPAVVHSTEEVGQTETVGPVEVPLEGSGLPQDKGSAVGGVNDDQGTGPVTPIAVETPPSSSIEARAKTSAAKGSSQTLNLLCKEMDPPAELADQQMTLAERATLAWLVADRIIQSDKENLDIGGSTASVALIHSLDMPAVPWYSSKLVSITTAHVGDTRMLLCATEDGRAIPLTNYHHPDDRAEAERLRKLGAGMITDSFGEARWMGALANTRAFGDSNYKKVGVTAEPEVITQILKGDDYAFLIAFSDGVGGVMSDQEIVDLCRGAGHPLEASKTVMNFAEELGTDDNCTVVCIPLRGWGKVGGEDLTKQRREFRRSKVDIFRDGRN